MAVNYGAGPNAVTTNLTQTAPFGNTHALLFLAITASLSAIATITTAAQNVTVPGLQVGDIVTITKLTAQAGLAVISEAYVSTANTLPVTLINPTAGSITPTVGDTYYLIVKRPLGGVNGYLTSLPLNNEGGGTD